VSKILEGYVLEYPEFEAKRLKLRKQAQKK